MKANFSERLDQVFNLTKSIGFSMNPMLKRLRETLFPLVQEAYNTKLRIVAYNNGKWESVASFPLDDCLVIPQKDGTFQFLHNGSIQTYGPNCRFEIS